MNYPRSEAESLDPGSKAASPESHSCALMTNMSWSYERGDREPPKYFLLAAQTSRGSNIIQGHHLVTARPENETEITFGARSFAHRQSPFPKARIVRHFSWKHQRLHVVSCLRTSGYLIASSLWSLCHFVVLFLRMPSIKIKLRNTTLEITTKSCGVVCC